jgi:Rad3-related DNA helicase
MVHSKILQTQITTDFPEAKSLFGRSNYPCILDRSKNCAECISTKKKPCPVRDQCVYPIEKKKTLNHRLRILNYDYFLTETNHIGEFSGNPFSIVDEADNLENTLVNFISLSFTARSLERLGLEEGPARKTATCSGGLDAWREFAQEAILRAREIKSQLQKEIDAWFQIAEQWQVLKMKEADYYQNIITKATMFLENVDHSWLLEENKPNHEGRYPQGIKFIFRPLWITDKLAEEFLWKHSDTWVLMSASFLPMAINCKTLGIPIDEVDYM